MQPSWPAPWCSRAPLPTPSRWPADESVASAPIEQGTPDAGESAPVVDQGDAPLPPAAPVEETAGNGGSADSGTETPDAGTPSGDPADGPADVPADTEEQPPTGSGEEAGATPPATEGLPVGSEETPGTETPAETPAEAPAAELPLTGDAAPADRDRSTGRRPGRRAGFPSRNHRRPGARCQDGRQGKSRTRNPRQSCPARASSSSPRALPTGPRSSGTTGWSATSPASGWRTTPSRSRRWSVPRTSRASATRSSRTSWRETRRRCSPTWRPPTRMTC